VNKPVLDIAKLPAVDVSAQASPWTGLARGRSFFVDDAIRALSEKAIFYAQAGACVHFRGMAGSGKTSLALHVAEALGRPVTFLAGNDWLTSSDFIGREIGQSSVAVVDRYVQSVRRTETMTRSEWGESALAAAMERGHTLVYDEFTRASPQANSTLLSVLEEGVLMITDAASDKTCVRAHPNFRVLLTSNPHDYVGVNSAPDAMLDRVLTLQIEEPSQDTLTGIVAQRSGLDAAAARRVVRLVQAVRCNTDVPTLGSMRTSLLIARILAFAPGGERARQDMLATIAADVLAGRGVPIDAAEITRLLAADTETGITK
jgi:nitric oxide reductase NorQ protein